jgi:hypothetical protein
MLALISNDLRRPYPASREGQARSKSKIRIKSKKGLSIPITMPSAPQPCSFLTGEGVNAWVTNRKLP